MSRPRTLLNYATINDQQLRDDYSSSRKTAVVTLRDRNVVPLGQFQQYFGKVKPSFFQELKNIFGNSALQEHTQPLAPSNNSCHIQGAVLTARLQSLKKRRQGIKTPNNFNLHSFKTKQMYRKAKLNRLLKVSDLDQQQFKQDIANNMLFPEDRQIINQIEQLNKLRNSKQRKHLKDMPKRNSWTCTKDYRISPSKERDLLLSVLNSKNSQVFTVNDLNRAVGVLHHLTIRISPNISYFNVYVEEGNNAELLKMLVRRRTGWRVVEIPAIANFIWTQVYRKGVLSKRLTKRQKTEGEESKAPSHQMSFKTGKVQHKSCLSQSNNLKPSDSTFTSQLLKLIPNCTQQQIPKLKLPQSRYSQDLTINHNILIHNHFPHNKCITDKKNLLTNLTIYLSINQINVFDRIPESYLISDLDSPVLRDIQGSSEEQMLWIIKPGENSNRGKGIIITQGKESTLEEINKRLNLQNRSKKTTNKKSLVLQKYIVPLLYHHRKFDIRSYMLVTFLNKQLRVYCYDQCYIRTSSRPFDLQSTDRLVHLTNDAIQSLSHDYGKFEEGNKVSESLFSRFIDYEYHRKGGEGSIWAKLKKEMQQRCIEVIEASHHILLSGLKQKAVEQQGEDKMFYFQLFGMDFMIDQVFKLWLIEVNTNPAITHDCSKLLNLLIPRMLDNLLTLAVGPLMRPIRLPDTPFSNKFIAVYTQQFS